ncbi:hypothetical protein BJ878DRAFT_574667 [Calycina marina]|uniref:Uncharacterized protein n=1 Tax=Calycina marina TaxID=1763456 RepID=A0A9P7Z5L6_9HELO|nr:hypothetical protein BJ878DRAFT_574667 [Calycina marina]
MSHTYVTYNEGLEAKHLHLGNLVHDFQDPNSFDPYIEKGYVDISQVSPPWARSQTLDDFALTLGSSSADGDEEEEEDDSGDQSRRAKRYQVVAAAKTINIEIEDPKSFFNEITLKSAEANKWLSSRLSAAEALAQEKKDPTPQIWMVTGLILMAHATWTSLSSNNQDFVPGKQAPFDPCENSTLRRLSVSEHVNPTFGFRANNEAINVHGAVIHETGKYPGLRGWAVRYQKVGVKVLDGEKSGGNALKLKSGTTAMVEVNPDIFAENKNTASDGLDEEFFDAFLNKAEEVS